MKMQMKLLDRTLICLLMGGASLAYAQPMENSSILEPGPTTPTPEDMGAVSDTTILPERVVAQNRSSINLSNGGALWATEDPTIGQAELTVSSSGQAAFDGQKVTKPVSFYIRSNYSAFVQRYTLLLFDATDPDLVYPLAQLPVKVQNTAQVEWDGQLPDTTHHRVGDHILYVLRAYDAQGQYDQTAPRQLQLVRPEEFERSNQLMHDAMEKSQGTRMTLEQGLTQRLIEDAFSNNGLMLQNIPLYGSRIRIQGRNLPEDMSLSINGESYPIDIQRKFAAEYLLPIGQHRFDIVLSKVGASQDQDLGTEDTGTIHQTLDIDVTGRYFFGVGIADLTVSQNKISGSVAPFSVDGRYKDSTISDGRLAFYGKAKFRGKYLATAQADTTEKELKHLFDHFGKSYPYDVFRSLDPEIYYPTYGDDATVRRDVDTQGRFYFRVNWDKNEAIWGNYVTGFTGTEFSQYIRSLYGGALHWRSRATNPWGEENTLLRIFGSQPNTVHAHDELIGTGGSLYYLRHTEIFAGSDIVYLEIDDPTTGLTQQRIPLVRGTDYEIDQIQGRILLTRPLLQITRENVQTLTRDMPLNGFQQRLVIDYEYAPVGFDNDEVTAGIRAKQWLGDYVAVGATYVREDRAGEDYTLKGADVTLRAGQGTYLKLEHTQTQAFGVPSFFSTNGGLTFTQINPTTPRKGDANAVEARMNLRELGWIATDWTLGGWWRHTDPGYSTSYNDIGQRIEEYGADFFGNITPNWTLYGRYSINERGLEKFTQGQLTSQWHLGAWDMLSVELRRVQQDLKTYQSAVGLLSAVRYTHQWNDAAQVYAQVQSTLNNDHHRYKDNNAYTVGGNLAFGQSSTVGAEYTHGDRGHAGQVNAEYRITPGHAFYGVFTSGNYTKDYDPVFANALQEGWTLGQRWQISNQVNIFNESQYLKPDTNTQSGLAHTFGLDFYPAPGWVTGFTLQQGKLMNLRGGEVKRRAVSANAGRNTSDTNWQSRVEWRRDSGDENRDQWVFTNRLAHRFDDSFRVSARMNYSKTHDDISNIFGAKFIEGNVGFAWRPWNASRWGVFGRYTYLYDLATLSQIGGAQFDQRSRIVSLEGVYKISPFWEVSSKVARRDGQVRTGRGTGAWIDSNAMFYAGQLRYALVYKWYFLGEYRRLSARNGGAKSGWLVDFDREIGKNLRLGVGYNFTRFSDDLTDFDYRHKGFFINILGSY